MISALSAFCGSRCQKLPTVISCIGSLLTSPKVVRDILTRQVCSGQVSVDEAIVDCCSSGVLAKLSAYFVCVVPEIGEDFALTTTAMPQQLVAHHRRGRENIVPPPVRGNERRMFL